MTDTAPEDGLERTGWATSTAMMREYYDTEWGVPITHEAGLYERLCLEGFQAGLSWATILGRREAFRRAFADFDPDAVANFTEEDAERLVQDASIIRSRAKIRAAIGNARAVLELRRKAAAGSASEPSRGATNEPPTLAAFDLPLWDGGTMPVEAGLPALIWSFCPETTPMPRDHTEVPTQSETSTALAKTLKKNGFTFIGPTSAYALMEAIGMVDTHWVTSHRRGISGIFGPEGTRRPVE